MADRILTLDIGSSKALLAEFSVRGNAAPTLVKFVSGNLPIEGDDVGSSDRLAIVLRQLMAEGGFRPAPLYVSLPGQTVFPRFVKFPAVSKDKVGEMVAAEAEQNIPFPMDEVVWDYQTVGDEAGVERDAVIFAVKLDNVRSMGDAIAAMELEPEVVDAAPAALYNAVRYCGAGRDGCTMVLDIGFRSTGLLFVEGDKVFTRNISVAGYSITQEIQKNLNCSFQEAEQAKLQMGMVSLGSTYALEDERADRLSKIIRNVVTRLHAEVMRSINFYRSQQGGSAPTKLLLTGTSSLLPYMDQFFAEKFQIEVEYFNPFEVFGVDPNSGLDLTSANQVVQLGLVAGLALRHTHAASLQMNLLPPAIVARKTFRRRVPFFVFSAIAMLAAAFLWMRYAGHKKESFEKQFETIEKNVKDIDRSQSRIHALANELQTYTEKTDMLTAMAQNRAVYSRCLSVLVMRLPKGAWIQKFVPVNPSVIHIEGLAFEDDLKANHKSGDGALAMDAFINALLGTTFSKAENVETSILKQNDLVRRFSFDLTLVQPISAPYTVAAQESDEAKE